MNLLDAPKYNALRGPSVMTPFGQPCAFSKFAQFFEPRMRPAQVIQLCTTPPQGPRPWFESRWSAPEERTAQPESDTFVELRGSESPWAPPRWEPMM